MNDASAIRPPAPRPAPLVLVRAYIALNAMIGDNPDLKDVQDEIKLAALHLEDAIRTLRSSAELQDAQEK